MPRLAAFSHSSERPSPSMSCAQPACRAHTPILPGAAQLPQSYWLHEPTGLPTQLSLKQSTRGASAQFRPQPPQFGIALVALSQPAAGLQSPKPVLHEAMPHDDAAQPGEALGSAGQMVPHAPQLSGSLLVTCSQPFVGSRSQSPKPGLQLTTVQVPGLAPLQLTVELGTDVQAVLQQIVPTQWLFAHWLSVVHEAPFGRLVNSVAPTA